jgi:hypothetical protein
MSDGVSPATLQSREIRLWWPLPLAAIIWLLIVWKFGNTLTSHGVEAATSAPITASFVELPGAAPGKILHTPGKFLPVPAGKSREITRPAAPSDSGSAATKPLATAAPSPAPVPDPLPPKDFMAHVNAGRERLRAAELAGAREYAEARARQRSPSSDEIRTANIMRNLQPQGTHGVFQIIRVGGQTAQYSFRGWTSNSSNHRQEMIEIDAGPGGDVERAIVRSMIALIRGYYKGDFNWESQRLQRVIVLSARMEDNAGLEDFLMREFFAAGAGLYGRASRNRIQ